MPRIIVISDAPTEQPTISLNEDVRALLLDDPHKAVHLLEQIAGALEDAEVIEHRAALNAHADRHPHPIRERLDSTGSRRIAAAQPHTATAIGA